MSCPRPQGESGFEPRTHDSNHYATVPLKNVRIAKLICNGPSDKRAVNFFLPIVRRRPGEQVQIQPLRATEVAPATRIREPWIEDENQGGLGNFCFRSLL